jgi:hypothetical protein
MVDADSILSGIVAPRRLGRVEKWLENEPDTAATFWEVMERGYRDAGHPFAHVMAAFRQAYPEMPEIQNQQMKRVVDQYDDDDGKPYDCHGETWREGRGLVIDLSERKCRTWQDTVATLIHEYCHCVLWGPASIEFDERVDDHAPHFYTLEGTINNRWDHDLGSEEANEFPLH